MKQELLILIYKIVNNLIKHNCDLKQIKSLHAYETRRRSDFNVNFFQSAMCEHNVIYKGINEFNKLSSDVKNSNTVKLFKKNLVLHLEKIF